MATLLPWDLIEPAVATVLARETPDNFADVTLDWLPEVEIQDVRFRRRRSQTTNTTAKFRSWNTESPIGERNFTLTTDEGKFVPIADKLPLEETDQLQLFLAQRVGTTGPIGGPALDQMLEIAYNDLRTSARRIRNRMSLARGQVLYTGKLTFTNENGLNGLEADFGVISGQKPTAGVLWTDPTAPAVDHERAWIVYSQNLSGKPITRALTSERVRTALLSNNQYRQALYPGMTLTNIPNLTLTQLDSIRASLGLPPITVFEHQVSVDGVSTRLIPDNRFILGVGDLGETQWGITPSALNLVNTGVLVARPPSDGQIGAAGLIGGTWYTPDPPIKWTKVDGAGIPLLADPTGILIATVAS